MTHEQLEHEMNYRAALALAKSILSQGVITEDDYRVINTIMISKFRPLLAGLYPKST